MYKVRLMFLQMDDFLDTWSFLIKLASFRMIYEHLC